MSCYQPWIYWKPWVEPRLACIVFRFRMMTSHATANVTRCMRKHASTFILAVNSRLTVILERRVRFRQRLIGA